MPGSGLGKHLINVEDYILGELIGKARSGRTFLAVKKNTERQVALKILWDIEGVPDQRTFIREICIPIRFSHPGLAKVIGFNFPRPRDPDEQERDCHHACIVSEFMPNGDLAKQITARHRGNPSPEFGPTEFSKAIFGIAATMAQVHKHNIVHRDLKPENILLDEMFEPRIADFGVSKVVSASTQFMMGASSFIYMAPELLVDGESYDQSVDVYAYGILLLQIFTHRLELTDGPVPSIHHLVRKVVSGTRFARPPAIPDSFWSLITRCWDQEPILRPTFARIVEELMASDAFCMTGTDLEKYREYQGRITVGVEELRLQ
jgi:serine/threonine protein kinase